MKAPLGYAVALVALLALPLCAQQQQRRISQPSVVTEPRRVALVIGNSAYLTAALKNPVNDARAMREALLGFGFEVIHREDLKREDMRRAIRDFGAKISKGGVGLFYYAGHGVQVRGENYLIPVDAAPESADEVDDDGVNAGYVLEKMESAGNGMNIVILDACRNNPFTRSFRSGSDGLASINAPTGTLIAYATAPGAVASDGGNSSNGVYTQELLRILKTPGLGIEEVFKHVRIAVRQRTQGRQTPWQSSSLTGDFYFMVNKRTADGGTIVVPPAAPAVELESSAKTSNDKTASEDKASLASPCSSLFGKKLYTSFIKPGPCPIPTFESFSVEGSLSEIVNKRKVYVAAHYGKNSLFDLNRVGSPITYETNHDFETRRSIIKRLMKYKGIEIVETPESSNFILHYSDSRVDGHTPMGRYTDSRSVIIIARGATQSDGSHLGRIIWAEGWSIAPWSSAPRGTKWSSSDDLTRHFVDALKKLRGEK